MTNQIKKRPVVFLDRDGTLNVEAGYIKEVNQLVLIEGAAEAVKRLNRAGIAAVLVTNQTGAARGYYSEEHIHALHVRLKKLLGEGGATLDEVYYCPHFADGVVPPFNVDCSCRKPATGMIDQAFAEHPEFDRALAFVVGDKATDVELAINSKAKGILVTTGYGDQVLKGEYQWKVQPDHCAESIVDAVQWIIEQLEVSQRAASERSK